MSLIICRLLSDEVWFSAFQIALAVLTLWAFLRMNLFREESPVSGVSRGEKSRGFLMQIAPLVLTALVSVVITITTFPADGKVFFYLLSVGEVLYLTLKNNWSINKLIGLLVWYEKRDFNPHH